MSLNIITVTLNMDTVNFLGISIVGQSNKNGDGDCGIYVGTIMKGTVTVVSIVAFSFISCSFSYIGVCSEWLSLYISEHDTSHTKWFF